MFSTFTTSAHSHHAVVPLHQTNPPTKVERREVTAYGISEGQAAHTARGLVLYEGAKSRQSISHSLNSSTGALREQLPATDISRSGIPAKDLSASYARASSECKAILPAVLGPSRWKRDDEALVRSSVGRLPHVPLSVLSQGETKELMCLIEQKDERNWPVGTQSYCDGSPNGSQAVSCRTNVLQSKAETTEIINLIEGRTKQTGQRVEKARTIYVRDLSVVSVFSL